MNRRWLMQGVSLPILSFAASRPHRADCWTNQGGGCTCGIAIPAAEKETT
jgi:hypothetical protein